MPKSTSPYKLCLFGHCGARGSLQKATCVIRGQCWEQQCGTAENGAGHVPALITVPLTVLSHQLENFGG